MKKKYMLFQLAMALLPVSADAGEVVQRFANPAFSGGAAASSHFLSVANAINDFKDPATQQARPTTPTAADPTSSFARQLESRLLSNLSNQVVDAIFGANPQDHGEIDFGSQHITFNRGLESVTVTIFNAETGQTTEVSVPTLQTN